MGFGYWSFSVRLLLSGTTFLLTSNTAILSHSSKLLLKPFSLLLPTLTPSQVLDAVLHFFPSFSSADVFTDDD